MKLCSFPHSGAKRAAVCAALAAVLCCGCAVLPTASRNRTDTSQSNALYNSSRLEDGKLRSLYNYNNSYASTTILCGGKVLHQSAHDEIVTLLQDSVTGETDYWFCSWSDPDGRGGRRSALYDKTGSEVLTFDGERSATIQDGLLVLQEDPFVDGEYNYMLGFGTCQVIDLSTGTSLPVPEGADSCTVCDGLLVYNFYTRPAGLADDEWDSDAALHSWIIVQTRDGSIVNRIDSARVMTSDYESADAPNGWLSLRTAFSEDDPYQIYNPSTGEFLSGYVRSCGSGTACFSINDEQYELRDMTAAGAPVLGTFDALPCLYFPGYAVLFHDDNRGSYSLYDLAGGAVTPLYEANTSDSTVALYAKDGSLKVYDASTGALRSELEVGTVKDDQRINLYSCGDDYIWLEVDDDSFHTVSARVYGSEGLVTDLSGLTDTYSYLSYLTTDKAGKPLYYGRRDAVGSSNGSVYDVLDATGTVVLSNLSSCIGYYSNSVNALPDHVFEAGRGFYYGWMDTDGQWLYCQNIFDAIDSEDNIGY